MQNGRFDACFLEAIQYLTLGKSKNSIISKEVYELEYIQKINNF
jgi:hypothetical protein